MTSLVRLAAVLVVALVTGCAGGAATAPAATAPSGGVPSGDAPAAGSSTPSATPSAMRTAAPAPGATATPAALDLRAQRLRIPALRLDAPVQGSRVVPDTSVPPPGCPAPPPGQTTLTVPDRGLATPEEPIEGLEQRAWIFGHSRWLGEPGLLFGLPQLNRGDEVFVDGIDRTTATPVAAQRFVVDALYLTDIDSGGDLVSSTPAAPQVILQTSVREDGAGKPWILDRAQVTAKATNLVQGSLDDPCKYLLLFVVARAS